MTYNDFTVYLDFLQQSLKSDEKENVMGNARTDFRLNAGWEVRDGRNVCRWFVVCRLHDNHIVGCLGGYSGSGSFQMEQFVASYSDKNLTSLKIDLEDKVTEKEIDFFSDVDDDLLSICDDAQDVVFEWNDQDEWEEGDQLLLLEEKIEICKKDGDMLLHREGEVPHIKQILELAGITAAP